MIDEEDAISRETELEALKEIYADEFTLDAEGDDTQGWRGRFKVAKTTLAVRLPLTYPSQDCPVFELRELPKGADCTSLSKEFEDMFVKGEVVLFSWVEHLRETVAALELAGEDTDPKDVGQKEEEEEEGESVDGSEDEGEFEMPDYSSFAAKPGRAQTRNTQIAIISGDPQTTRKSTFQAHLAVISDPGLVEPFLAELKSDRKIAKATHNIMAYRIERQDAPGMFFSDNDDDGENAAGGRLAHLLEIVDARNVVVVVSRWYGGIQLGPSRFKLINNVARDLLEQQHLITSSGAK